MRGQGEDHLIQGRPGRDRQDHGLVLNDDRPIKLNCKPTTLMLRVSMQYEIVPGDGPERAQWRVSTRAYAYEMQTASGELVWSYHWHPNQRIALPHTHLGHTQLRPDAVLHQKAHNPTGRVSLESVVRACITEYGATPMKDDWEKTLELRESEFRDCRSWS